MVEKPCFIKGIGYTKQPLRQGDTVVYLQQGHGSFFPSITNGGYFFVFVESCDGCCGPIKVIATNGDNLTIENDGTCLCVPSNARVAYDDSSPAYIRAVVFGSIQLEPPLYYDCETQTIKVDCAPVEPKCGCEE